jgi:hypothetical protein
VEREEESDVSKLEPEVTALEPLLRRWSEIEPGRVNSRFSDDDHWSVDHYVTVLVAGQYENVVQVMNDGQRVVFHTAPAIVQVAVQEAIKARPGWSYRIGSDSESAHARVWREVVNLRDVLQPLNEGLADNEAEALLSAYLEALAAVEAAKETA